MKRCLIWIGTLGCAVTLAAAGVGLFRRVVTLRVDFDRGYALVLEGGTAALWWQTLDGSPLNSLAFELGLWTSGALSNRRELADAWSASIALPNTSWIIGWRSIKIPLYAPFAVMCIPTVWFWRVECRHRARPGHCANCGYNLTGNVTGRCSECGA